MSKEMTLVGANVDQSIALASLRAAGHEADAVSNAPAFTDDMTVTEANDPVDAIRDDPERTRSNFLYSIPEMGIPDLLLGASEAMRGRDPRSYGQFLQSRGRQKWSKRKK